jgi:multidrug resistance efflux pump
VKLKSELVYARYQQKLSANLAGQGAGPDEDAQKWAAQVAADEAGILEARAEAERARLRATSDIGGVNTKVAAIEAELQLARYYLNNTLIVAPEDGYIINLQVRPGMVAGPIRVGAIASFIVDADRYLLAQFYQENLKYVKPGQAVEVALDLYPGQIWPGKVKTIWQGSGEGQMLPSGFLPKFNVTPAEVPQGQFAVVITLDDPDQTKFPIGTQGRAAIYTNPKSGFAWMRRVGIRAYTWFNLIYPFAG